MKNETCANIHKELVVVYSGSCVSFQMVCKWQNFFLKGPDEQQSGSPSHALGDDTMDTVCKIVKEDRQ